MKRAGRIVLNGLTELLLLVCAATAVRWVLSVSNKDHSGGRTIVDGSATSIH